MTGLLVAAVAQVIFVHQYGVSDPNAYFLPGLAVAALALVLPAAGLLMRLRRTRFGVMFATAATVVALVLPIVLCLNMMVGRRRAFVELDGYFHGMWQSISYERAIVLWPADGCARLKEYQVFRGEKLGLDVYNTISLINDAPRSKFRRKYGFDPLAMTDRAHLREPLKPEFIIGEQSSAADVHGFALIHECIAERAGLPVVAFDPPRPPRTLSSKAVPSAPPAETR
jgi:hypothetical protein